MSVKMNNTQELHVVIGCLSDQKCTVQDTIPCLMSAALYADKITVVCQESDTLLELSDFFEIENTFRDFFAFDSTDAHYYNRKTGESIYRGEWQRELFEGDYDDFEREIKEKEGVGFIVESLLTSPNIIPLIYDPDGFMNKQSGLFNKLSKPTKIKQNADSHLGSGLIDTLPAIRSLPSSHVLELRKHLKPFLTPFRSFVVETSEALTNVNYDEESISDVIHQMYVGKILPIIKEINDEWRVSNFIKSIFRDLAKDPKKIISTFLTFGIGEIANLPMELSVGIATANLGISSLFSQQEKRNELKKNKLYLLHELERKIGKIR